MNTPLSPSLIVKIIALLAFVAATSTLIVGLNQQQAHQQAALKMAGVADVAGMNEIVQPGGHIEPH